MMRMLECSSPPSEAWGGVPTGKDSVSLKSGQWEFDYASLSICTTQTGLGPPTCVCVWGGVDLGGQRIECDQGV